MWKPNMSQLAIPFRVRQPGRKDRNWLPVDSPQPLTGRFGGVAPTSEGHRMLWAHLRSWTFSLNKLLRSEAKSSTSSAWPASSPSSASSVLQRIPGPPEATPSRSQGGRLGRRAPKHWLQCPGFQRHEWDSVGISYSPISCSLFWLMQESPGTII